MLIKVLSFVVLLASLALTSAVTTYQGYKVYDVFAKSFFEKELLVRLSEHPDFDFFHLPRQLNAAARVMVKPEDQATFEELLQKFSLKFQTVNQNVGKSLEQQREFNGQIMTLRSMRRGISFQTFHRFNEINNYLDELARKYPSRVAVTVVGTSYERRDLKAITISNGDGRRNKKVIFVDAGIHAREWIAPAGALYIIYQLVENFAANADLLKNYDWIVLPVVNPDGYEYTHTNQRLWRKTRKPVTSNCVGTDANRNFDFHWGEVGASNLSCSDTYRGRTAFSEPETQIVRDILHSIKGRGKFYLTMHSYGNYLLYPWGWTSALPNSWRDIDEVARAGANAILYATGTKYTVGSSTNVLYAAAGGSDDYAFAVADFPISITMELPAGGSGFDPKPQQIESMVKETWIGVRAMALTVIEKY